MFRVQEQTGNSSINWGNSGFPPTIVGADALIGPMAVLFGEQALHSIENAKKQSPNLLICYDHPSWTLNPWTLALPEASKQWSTLIQSWSEFQICLAIPILNCLEWPLKAPPVPVIFRYRLSVQVSSPLYTIQDLLGVEKSLFGECGDHDDRNVLEFRVIF